MPVRSPVWSACRWVMKIASSCRKSRPASTNAEGEPRPQSIMNTRSSTMSADEIPPRPATGMGAPAVPRSTNSVVMLASLVVDGGRLVVLQAADLGLEDAHRLTERTRRIWQLLRPEQHDQHHGDDQHLPRAVEKVTYHLYPSLLLSSTV